MGKEVLLLVVSVTLLVPLVLCSMMVGDIPRELTECVQQGENKTGNPNAPYTTTADIHAHCLQLFLWKSENVQWSSFNITERDKDFITSLIGSYVHRGRKRRQAGPGSPPGRGRGRFPQTGFRVRREYRRLPDRERFAFHAAINQMKMSGQYDMFANLHRGMVLTSAHGGPNFLGWHRVYLALVEEALRRINPRLSLPYWDSSLDFDMENPARSILWSTPFLGNGDGFVTTGPFSNWDTPVGRLTRNIAGGSRLFSKGAIRAIMTRCRIRDISEPMAPPQFNLEVAHGGPHVWVGGQMSGLNTAAHDPVFFLHHAFVDYIWEMFRIRQSRFCGVNPSRDYPPAMGEHAARRPMDGFPQYRNIDGIRSYWTRFWYRYESSPTCSMWRPFCGTPYLRCDMRRRRCVSVARMGAEPSGAAGFAGARMAFAGRSQNSAMRARAQESTVNIGPRFRAPPPEPRTQDGQRALAMGRRFRRAVRTSNNKTDTANSRVPPKSNFGPTFAAPPSDGRTSDVLGDNFAGVTGLDPAVEPTLPGESLFPASYPAPLLPSSEYQESPVNDLLKTPIQNSFSLNGHSNRSNWAFIPVRVVYTNNQGGRFSSFASFGSPQVANNRMCIQEPSGAIQVKVQSSGLNYRGTFTDFALMDTHLPADSTITYIGIKSPDGSPTQVLLTAIHSCGLMCQAHCVIPHSSTSSFQPCSGVLNIASNDRSVYSTTYKEAVAKVSKGMQLNAENVRVAFHCSNTDVSPWSGYTRNQAVF